MVNASGRASWMYLQNVSPCGSVQNQNVAVALQAADISLAGSGAFRVHGGGFAGTIQAYVPKEKLEKFISDMERVLYKDCCRVLKVRKTGAMAIELNEVY